ncbi:hypothetical protein BT96DRAFT_388346 [Gymnopus androsaceus JB14]|uniref:SPX domain-containing protein n=1 Tax=Gymnopus androsaceus JB14 TaxID=1447944 RepID=A0A6A4I021_9AGAR|nr:hypothetical protein BT96DRAFT_388346 [Gymnopus androsaceus JB14]
MERKRLHSTALDPDEYQAAKKKLKKAVIEHYRGLEMLQNYRILNITGFRKALKKFEKVTKIPLQHAYMNERVETSSFASDKKLRSMIDEMEALFASHFTHGDNKRAKAHLRTGGVTKTHHYSTFRSGLLLGIGIPALISGVVFSFQAETRSTIPGWDGLLFVYSVLLIPVVFSLLNWTHERDWIIGNTSKFPACFLQRYVMPFGFHLLVSELPQSLPTSGH